MDTAGIIAHLRSLRNPANIEGQRQFGIKPRLEHLGIAMPELRRLARGHRRNHALALELWGSGVHEAQVLAAHVDDPLQVTSGQMEAWVRTFDSWAICDQVCMNLFDRTPHAVAKAASWSTRRSEYVRRAGFALMASLAWHQKDLPDRVFRDFLPMIRREASDDRNFVKKAANWALRQIGKRNPALRRAAIAEARRIRRLGSRSARWIAADALRELER